MLENFGVSEANWRDTLRDRPGLRDLRVADVCRQGLAALAAGDADRGGGRHRSSARPPAGGRLRRHATPTVQRPDCWGYIEEHGIEEQSGAGVEAYR